LPSAGSLCGFLIVDEWSLFTKNTAGLTGQACYYDPSVNWYPYRPTITQRSVIHINPFSAEDRSGRRIALCGFQITVESIILSTTAERSAGKWLWETTREKLPQKVCLAEFGGFKLDRMRRDTGVSKIWHLQLLFHWMEVLSI